MFYCYRMMDILPVKCSQTQAASVAEKSSDPAPSVKPEVEVEIDYFDFTWHF